MTPADVARKSVYANEKVVKFLDEQIRLKKLAAGDRCTRDSVLPGILDP